MKSRFSGRWHLAFTCIATTLVFGACTMISTAWGQSTKSSVNAIPVGFDTVYLVREGGAILIDGGESDKCALAIDGLAKAGLAPGDIKLIVITHGHYDHIGCVAQLKALTGAPVAMHHSERDRLEKPITAMPPGSTLWGKVLAGLLNAAVVPRVKLTATKVDIPVSDDGMSLEPFGIRGKVVHTPGHSPGSLCVVLDSGDAFVGDLAMNKIPLRMTPGLPIFAEDPSLLRGGVEKLLATRPKTIYPAHGDAFPAEVLRRALDSN